MLPRLDAERLADDIPLVVFHALVRVHVPADRRAAFDSAIAALGARRRVLHVSLEFAGKQSTARPGSTGKCAARDLARVEGHGRWVQPSAMAVGGVRPRLAFGQRRFTCMTCSPTRPCRGWSNASGTVPTIENPSVR